MLRKLLHILSTPTKLLFILQISLSTATIPLTLLPPPLQKKPLLIVCASSLGVQVLFICWLLGDLYRGPRGLRGRWYYLPRGGGAEGEGRRGRSRIRGRDRAGRTGEERARREGLDPPIRAPPPPVYEEGGFWSGGMVVAEPAEVVGNREREGISVGVHIGGSAGGGGGEQVREEGGGDLSVGRVRRVL